MGRDSLSGDALVAAAADADPVTRLVLGWLTGKRSQNTRSAYACDIGITPPARACHAPSWLAWCERQGVHPVTGVTGMHVARYARELQSAGLSPASAARKLTAVSGWYAWLARRGHIAASPATDIARPRPTPCGRPTPGLTRDQALALMRAADHAPGPQQARTAALMAVLLFTGARVSEVIDADIGDLGTDQGRRVLQFTRHDGHRHSLPLPGPAAARLDAYLSSRGHGPRRDAQAPAESGRTALVARRTAVAAGRTVLVARRQETETHGCRCSRSRAGDGCSRLTCGERCAGWPGGPGCPPT